MDKHETKKIKEQLDYEKKNLEAQLGNFAKKDEKLKGDWDTRYPEMQTGATGSQLLEEEADEVEEYVNLLPVEHNLENRLQAVNLALDKIKKGKYGVCEKCGEKINNERLKVCPEAKLCAKCQKIKKK